MELPSHVGTEFEVYLNGVPQQRGTDYVERGRTLVFRHELAREGKLGFWRWFSLLLGVAGTYRKNDTVDVVYTTNGQRKVVTLQVARPSSSA